MTGRGDRMARAGDYVLGLMNEAERERAERDLEIDPAFRDAVMQLAERMHVFSRAETPDADDRWKQISERLAGMPQMHAADDGRAATPVIRRLDRPAHGIGLHGTPGRRSLFVALGLIAAFALGYLAGKS